MKRIFLLISMLFLSVCLIKAQVGQDERTLSADSLITADNRLDSIYRTLPEVMVMGERPVVKADVGKLVYDLPRMINKKTADNVYEALKYLPGVMEEGEQLTLSGQHVKVILDGKVTSMGAEQLYSLLKSMPADRIDHVEVMYSAPPRYQTRGAVININLRHTQEKGKVWQGELFGEIRHEHKASYTERGSLLYTGKNLSLDVIYRHGHGDRYSTIHKHAKHTLNSGETFDISSSEISRKAYISHNAHVGMDYSLGKQHTVSLMYDFMQDGTDGITTTNGFLNARTTSDGKNRLHNLRADYMTPIGLKLGTEMTYYKSPYEQIVESSMQDEQTAFATTETQKINRWNFYLGGEHEMAQGWSFNYGGKYQTSIDHSSQIYTSEESDKNNMISKRKESMLTLYAGVGKRFGKKLSADLSIETQQYKTSVWNEWKLYPTLNISYLPKSGHLLQLAFNTSNSYPAYWAVQNTTSYINAYSEIQGNPMLKPDRTYSTTLVYIYKSKYVFQTWFNHTDEYGTQTLYQSSDRLAEIYKYLNFDYQNQAGIMASIPFSWGKWWDARVNAIAIWMKEKDSDFYDIPFNRSKWLPILSLNSTFTLTPALSFQVNGRLQGKAIQATYDLPSSKKLDISLKYTFKNNKGNIRAYCNDLFESSEIDPYIRYATQWVANDFSCFREFGLSLTYKFGGYKEKKRAAIDSSRFK